MSTCLQMPPFQEPFADGPEPEHFSPKVAAEVLSDSQLEANHYHVIEELGVGLQGRVDLAFDEQGKRYVAIKLPTFDPIGPHGQVDLLHLDCQVQSIIQEREAHRLVHHQNVLEFIRSVPGKKKHHSYVVLVLEFASNGDLYDLLARTGAMPENLAKFYFHQLLLAVGACHDSGVIHRDVKPENILFDQDYTLKLCDFGLATVVSGDVNKEILTDPEGTSLYMAPEILTSDGFLGPPVDVWSCGVVLFIMLTGFPPFEVAEEGDYCYDCLISGRMQEFWAAQPASITKPSASATDLINGMLCVDPTKRLTTTEILSHPWLQDVSSLDPMIMHKEMAKRRSMTE